MERPAKEYKVVRAITQDLALDFYMVEGEVEIMVRKLRARSEVPLHGGGMLGGASIGQDPETEWIVVEKQLHSTGVSPLI